MEFDLKQLRFFITIADTGGFSKAAKVLGIAQSALSHHISQMESRLGVALLERSAKGAALTENGRRLYEHGTGILAAAQAASEDVRGAPGEPRGLVRLGCSLTVMPHLIGPLMVRLAEVAPRVTLHVIDRLSPQLIHALGENEIDLAVCFNAEQDHRIAATPLFEEPVCLVGAPDLIGPSEGPISLDNALTHPLLLPGRDHTLRGMVDSMALLRNQSIVVRHECFSLHALTAGLEHGLAAALISKFSALSLWQSGKVICRPLCEPPVTRTLSVATRAQSPETSALSVVRTLITRQIETGVTSGAWPDTTLFSSPLA